MPHEWDATTYGALRLPHEDWGRRVLDRARLAGDETVLDAGCGTGRDAAELRRRWPHVTVIALDGSQRMLDAARERLGDADTTYLRADLMEPLPISEPVDAVVSVAAFHWVRDHDLLFAHLAAVMRPGARLSSDCGGRGNVVALDAAISRVTGIAPQEWEFAGVSETHDRLVRAGFDVDDVRLRPSPFRCADPTVFEQYLASVCLSAQLKALPTSKHAEFVREVRLAFDEPVIDYVRLEVDAVRR